MTLKEIFEFFFEGQSIDTIIILCFGILSSLVVLALIIYFFVHSWLNDDGSSNPYPDPDDDDFWAGLAIWLSISDEIDRAYSEAEEEALKDDPDSVHYNIY